MKVGLAPYLDCTPIAEDSAVDVQPHIRTTAAQPRRIGGAKLTDLSRSVPSAAIAAFGGSAKQRAAKIDYDIALPETVRFQCIHDLHLGALGDIWTEIAKKAGNDLPGATGIEIDKGHPRIADAVRLHEFIENKLSHGVVGRPPVVPRPDPGPNPRPPTDETPLRRALPGAASTSYRVLLEDRAATAEMLASQIQTKLDRGAELGPVTALAMPVGSFLPSGAIRMLRIPETAPRVWIIEEYEVISFLGDFGLGKVVSATTLLPNEEQFLSSETWREDQEVLTSASSIFDSFDESAQDRFMNSLENRSASTSSAETVGANYFSHTGEGGWGAIFGGHSETEATLTKTDYRNSSDEFCSAVSAGLSEHASQANSRRETFITSGSLAARRSGGRNLTERRIRNTNLRRTLSFVFRELNQCYQSCVVLRNLKVMFGNGRPGSLDSAELSSLQTFIRKYVKPANATQVLTEILEAIATTVDYSGKLVTLIEMTDRSGQLVNWNELPLDSQGALNLPAKTTVDNYIFRFKPQQALKTDVGDRTVPGVVRRIENVVMRTGSIITEALLGEADALDPYATALQEIDLEGRRLDNKRVQVALDLVGAITDPSAGATAYQAMLTPANNVDVRLETVNPRP
jgi:hypothetical protein